MIDRRARGGDGSTVVAPTATVLMKRDSDGWTAPRRSRVRGRGDDALHVRLSNKLKLPVE
jgi:hypothetical protein